MNNKIKRFFCKEPYPSFPEEWDNPQNTVFREFYLRNSNDFLILHELVKKHMSDRGNEGITRYRLMKILYDSHCRAFHLVHQKRNHPHTWFLRWKFRCVRLYIHRRLKTRHFKNQVELCRIADDVVKKMISKDKSTDSND